MTLRTIHVSENVYQRLIQYAQASELAIDRFANKTLDQSLPPALDIVPERFRAELSALPMLDDAALWEVARRDLNDGDAAEYEHLLQRNSAGTVTPTERIDLTALREQADLLMFGRSYALLLLKRRGHHILN